MINKDIGLSKYVISGLGGFLIGLYVANFFTASLYWFLIIIPAFLVLIAIFRQKTFYRLVLLGIVAVFIGMAYLTTWEHKENQKTLIYNQDLVMSQVKVESLPKFDGSKQIVIVSYKKTKIQITTSRYQEYEYGDILEIKGKIQDPHEIISTNNFNYGRYLLKLGIRGIIQNPDEIKKTGIENRGFKTFFYRKIYWVGSKFRESINKVLPEPEASLGRGLILGDRTLPDSLNSAFNRAGVTHIIAVSGYNVTIIISALAIVFSFFGRRSVFWGSLVAVLVFVVLTGAAASVVRAGILAMLVIWGKSLGRRIYYPVLILFTAVLMLLFTPYALKNDISFQLSFLAFAGIVFLAPKIGELKILDLIPEKIRQVLSETLSAQILVLPILIYNFGVLSIVSPLTNIFILLAVPWAMAAVFLAGFSGLFWLQIGKIIALLSWVFLKYILVVAEFFSRISFAAVSLKTSEWWWIPIYYILIIIWLRFHQNHNKKINETKVF